METIKSSSREKALEMGEKNMKNDENMKNEQTPNHAPYGEKQLKHIKCRLGGKMPVRWQPNRCLYGGKYPKVRWLGGNLRMCPYTYVFFIFLFLIRLYTFPLIHIRACAYRNTLLREAFKKYIYTRRKKNKFMFVYMHTCRFSPNRLTSLLYHTFYKYFIWSKSSEKWRLGGTYYLATFNQFWRSNNAF